jgi:PPOX class probable F420-dependent enzyme
MNIPISHSDLLLDETKAFAYLATSMKDGTPQVTPVWFNMEGDLILINSTAGRVKDKNMRARPGVALVIADPRNPYRYLQVRGVVTQVQSLGAEDHIDILNQKYRGTPVYDRHNPAQPRVIYKIQVQKSQAMG